MATKCPACGTPGAKKFLWMVKCVNKTCSKFDMEHYMASDALHGAGPAPAAPAPAPSPAPASPPPAGSIEIRYRNFRGEEKSYFGDPATVRSVGRHISLCLAPTGRRCAFSKDRIHNLSQLTPTEERRPTAREAQILGYYRKRGGSSAEYERIRREYPDAGKK